MRLNNCLRGYFSTPSDINLNYLSDEEVFKWNNEKRYRRNCMDWLLGRIAVKTLLLDWFRLYKIGNISPKEITIENTNSGIPMVKWSERFGEPPKISISHSNSIGYAICSKDYLGIGCDLEVIKERNSKFVNYFLSVEERSLLSSCKVYLGTSEWETALWVMKEAAAKSICSAGYYTNISLSDIKIKYCFPSSYFGQFKFNYDYFRGMGYCVKQCNYIFGFAYTDY